MTPQLHLHILASGSKGNAAVVEGPAGSVLVDCGISRRELLRRGGTLGVDVEAVDAVIVTHEHSDHVSGLPAFCNNYGGPVFSTAGTASARKSIAGTPFELVGHDDVLELAGMTLRLFPTSHDVADPFGIRFEASGTDGEPADAVGWCTDTGVLTAEALGLLRDARILGIESNHDSDMLKNGPYPYFLRQRVGGERGHLSNDQCADALPLLVGEDTETVVALHLSQKNNRPSVCMRTLAAAMGATVDAGRPNEARTPDGLLSLCCASQTEPLTIW